MGGGRRGAGGGSANSPQEHGWGGRGEGGRRGRVEGQKGWLAQARLLRAGSGSLLTKAGLGPPCSWKGCLFPIWPPRDCGARGLQATFPRFRNTAAAWPFSCRCLPASLRELPRPEQGPVGGSQRAHTRARGRQRAGGEGTSRTCEQTGGVAQDAGPIHTLWSRNRKAGKMRMQTRFPKLWSAGWGCSSRPAPGEQSAARHHGRDVVCHEPRGIRGEHERSL